MTDPTKRFSDRVEFYVRSRPRYPSSLLRFFQNDLQLSPEHVVADIGSGTGFLTELFVRNGNPTYAVEPNDEMRAAAEAHLGEWKNFHSVRATAEATTLANANVNFITAGQAFHWFKPDEARREFLRILKPAGYVALVWNERKIDASAFNRAYQTMIEKYQIDHTEVRRKSMQATDDSTLGPFFGSVGVKSCVFDNPQMLDRQGLIDRIASSSYMPLANDPRHKQLIGEANALFDSHQENGAVRIAQETHVYYGQLQ
jgi:SAM-dependent methyltransferase